jgi:hypothetical protein
MTTDLYTSEIDDDVYGTLLAEMNVHGLLRIIAYDPKSRDLVGCCQFPPAPEGLNEIEQLIIALQEWVRHVKSDLNPTNLSKLSSLRQNDSSKKSLYRKFLAGDNVWCEVNKDEDGLWFHLGNSFEGHPSPESKPVHFGSEEQFMEFCVKLIGLNDLEEFEAFWLKYG